MEGECEYMRLLDALQYIGQKINVYGVVVDYVFGRATSGRDFVCSMTIVDMSYFKNGLKVVCFAREIGCLPKVKALGDIIRLQRVQMGVHENRHQAVARIKRPSSFLLFQGDSNSYRPYQTCSGDEFTFEDRDRGIVELIRAWSPTRPDNSPAMDHYLIPIANITQDSSFDLCCKMVYHRERDGDEEAVMYIWDGTAAPELSYNDSLQDLPLDVIRKLPARGSVIRVIMSVSGCYPEAGSWVRLRDLKCKAGRCGRSECVISRESKTKICLMDQHSQLIKIAQSHYQQRLLLFPNNSPSPSYTVTDYGHVPLSSLREVVAYPHVTSKFRCMVCLKECSPYKVEAFSKNGVYKVEMRLADETGEIKAYLYGDDGAKFFNQLPPNAGAESYGLEVLRGRISRLIIGKAWIECCLKSYYTKKDEPWESRRFRIFGTILLDAPSLTRKNIPSETQRA